MPNYFSITLDTTGPSSPSLVINNGDVFTANSLVTLTISTADTPTTGYQMKIWGDLDQSWAITNGILAGGATGTTESDAQWISYSSSKQVTLSSGDGAKTIYAKIRDDVNNESPQVSDSISLDTALATVTISGPDVTKVSKQAGKDTAHFTFQSSKDFAEFKVTFVNSTSAGEAASVVIPSTNGSTGVSGTGTYVSGTPYSVTLKGADIELASSGDGSKTIKVFVKDNNGTWSS